MSPCYGLGRGPQAPRWPIWCCEASGGPDAVSPLRLGRAQELPALCHWPLATVPALVLEDASGAEALWVENTFLPTGSGGGPCIILREPKCHPQLTCPVRGQVAPAGRARTPGQAKPALGLSQLSRRQDAWAQAGGGWPGALPLCQGVWPRKPELFGNSQGSVCLGFYRLVLLPSVCSRSGLRGEGTGH